MTPRARLDSLTGLRWFAAFGVFLYHYRNIGTPPGLGLAVSGYTGVAFFFVLSGFVLTWSARPGVGLLQFYVRRFARIWPAHMVALLLALPVFTTVLGGPSAGTWQDPWSWTAFLASILLIQGFWLDPAIFLGGNPAAWTLSCEAVFYALQPLALRWMRRLAAWGLLAVGIAAVAYGAAVTVGGIELPVALSRLWEFVLGMLAALALRRGVRFHVPWIVPFLIACAFVVGYWLLWGPAKHLPELAATLHPWQGVGIPLLYAVVIAMFASVDSERRFSPMRWRLLVIGGDISYAFYLMHATVLYAYKAQFGKTDSPWVLLGVFAAAVVAACLLHYGVERPCERRIRRWGDRRLAPEPAMVVTAAG